MHSVDQIAAHAANVLERAGKIQAIVIAARAENHPIPHTNKSVSEAVIQTAYQGQFWK